MKHLNVLLMKFVASLIVFWISLDLFFEAAFVDILSFSLLITVASYFVGDQILLPRIGKMNAVVTDFFLTYLIVWIFGGILFESYLQVAWGSIISALLIAGSEVLVHSYILKNITPVVRETRPAFNQSFAYEFAEDQDPKPEKE
ncbi:YndM family protein [Bacillus salacetis]|uniref:YndM family protein n=1 Tax=Bacillus salacetis TaxID=2315464 RepID=UPI003BA16FF1